MNKLKQRPHLISNGNSAAHGSHRLIIEHTEGQVEAIMINIHLWEITLNETEINEVGGDKKSQAKLIT